MDPDDLVEGMTDAARRAGRLLVSRAGPDLLVERKNRHELVTATDLESQDMLRQELGRLLPEAAFLGEEGWGGEIPPAPLWVVDPLDGTNNYAHGYPVYCVSIAYVDQQGVLAGCVHDPNRDETFTSTRGKGCFLNGSPVETTVIGDLESALLATGFPYHRRIDGLGVSLKPLYYFLSRVDGIRRGGSAALDLCYVACGRLDGFWEEHLKPWDMAAGVLMVSEAGGKVSDVDGGSWSLSSRGVIASGPGLHEQIGAGVEKGFDAGSASTD
jgi:myo-inositol-1(or 4)-monophosphatase